ncbi:branched-chain amino acid ABC transporter permease [Bradyrhizobium brasilense]|uniref:branched-chain amino acid ABC transporter permease n=1 Tax=Bradyrhizobium brasilense TaxID=1419277 RepID=UPI0014579433|nr:branched-chain amino acid ABC transporter permease [Bradyrhizobium brasilense]NLS68176.1 branched-chain amino acid ABC transporter permease [Bradyrhizobium brasilense]
MAAMLPQLLVAGVVSGSIYALAALGLVVVFKATRVVNFAHGNIILLGAYICVTVVGKLGFSYVAGCLVAVAAVAMVGLLTNEAIYRRLLAAPHMVQVLATLAVANVIGGAVTLIWGAGSYNFPPSDRLRPMLTTPVVVTGQQFLIVDGAILAMLSLAAFFRWTRWGKAMRALSQNEIGANLCGIRTGKVFGIAVTLGAALGAIAAVLYAPLTLVDPGFGWLLIKGFAAAALGGLTSLTGAVVGGIVLGVCESLWVAVFPALWAPSLSYLIIIAVLLIKPTGLFGTPAIQKL